MEDGKGSSGGGSVDDPFAGESFDCYGSDSYDDGIDGTVSQFRPEPEKWSPDPFTGEDEGIYISNEEREFYLSNYKSLFCRVLELAAIDYKKKQTSELEWFFTSPKSECGFYMDICEIGFSGKDLKKKLDRAISGHKERS